MVTLAMQWQTAVSLTNDGESLTSDHRLRLSVFLPFVCLLILLHPPTPTQHIMDHKGQVCKDTQVRDMSTTSGKSVDRFLSRVLFHVHSLHH